MATRLYSSISVETTLASNINSSVTSMQVATGTASTLLGGVTVVANSQFTVALDPDTINEEIVFITAGPSGDTFTITRGRAGSSAVAHSTGATIKHVLTSDDLTAFAAGISPVSSLAFSGSTSGTTTVQATAVAGTNTLSLPATTSDTLAGIAATQTLTNKTLTSPTINTATIASSTLSAATLTGTLTAGGGVGTNGQVLQSTSTGVQWASTSTYSAPTIGSTSIPSGTTVTTIAGLTLTSPVLNTATSNNPILVAPEERTTVSATAATGTVNFDALTQGVLYYTSNASANWTLNVRGSSSATLNSILATGDSITVVFLVTQGSTAYYGSAFQIDGSSVTPKYQGGTAFTAGNASSIDAYTYTIVKTASATFTVFASQTKFA
jgi:hypothetical protein